MSQASTSRLLYTATKFGAVCRAYPAPHIYSTECPAPARSRGVWGGFYTAMVTKAKTLLGGPMKGVVLKVKEPAPKVVIVVLVRGEPQFAIPGMTAPYVGSYVLT